MPIPLAHAGLAAFSRPPPPVRTPCSPPGPAPTAASRRSTRSRSSTSSRRSRPAWPSSSRRSTTIASDAAPRRPSRTRSPRWSAPAARSTGSSSVYGVYSSTHEHAGVPGGRARDGAEARRVPATRSRRTRSCSRASRRSTRRARRSGLTPEQQRLAWLYYTNFVRAGREARRRGQEARSPRSTSAWPRSSRRSARTCSPTRPTTCSCLESEADLAGLPDVAARRPPPRPPRRAGRRASGRSLNTRSSMEPFLTYSDRRDLREKVWRTYDSRGDNGDAHDNNAIITEILKLRAERAKLLGYATHAHWRLENTMAQDAGARDGADGGGVDAGGRARPRGGRRHAGDRRQGGRRRSRSSPGTTATTPRRCARRSTTSTRTR